jgi:lipoprotein NlpD
MKAAAAILVVVLAGCAASRPAPVEDRSRSRAPVAAKPLARAGVSAAPAAPAVAVPEGSYLVKKGDTLYSIALENGADYRDVAQWNRLEDPSKIQIGQVLRVTPPEQKLVEVGKPKIIGRVEARPLGDAPAKPAPAPAPAPAAAAKAPPVAADPRPSSSASGDFIWPAKGKVIAGFAEPRSKGIDIDGKPGDPVVAAAAGRVTYTGTGIPGLGKLVVIRHESGFITVYAHNRDILVKEQQSVGRGQKIAELGNTDSDRPKLHFQIRKGAAAVDPMRYLPAL